MQLFTQNKDLKSIRQLKWLPTLCCYVSLCCMLTIAGSSDYVMSPLAGPTPRSLTFIEWRNKQGKNEIFRLKEQICNKWEEIGCLLDIPLSLLQSWEMKHQKDPLKCVNTVFCYWLENPTEYYPKTWKGLDSLLNHAQLGQVASDLKKALANALWRTSCLNI